MSWHRESYRHSLASRGIRTSFARQPGFIEGLFTKGAAAATKAKGELKTKYAVRGALYDPRDVKYVDLEKPMSDQERIEMETEAGKKVLDRYEAEKGTKDFFGDREARIYLASAIRSYYPGVKMEKLVGQMLAVYPEGHEKEGQYVVDEDKLRSIMEDMGISDLSVEEISRRAKELDEQSEQRKLFQKMLEGKAGFSEQIAEEAKLTGVSETPIDTGGASYEEIKEAFGTPRKPKAEEKEPSYVDKSEMAAEEALKGEDVMDVRPSVFSGFPEGVFQKGETPKEGAKIQKETYEDIMRKDRESTEVREDLNRQLKAEAERAEYIKRIKEARGETTTAPVKKNIGEISGSPIKQAQRKAGRDLWWKDAMQRRRQSGEV